MGLSRFVRLGERVCLLKQPLQKTLIGTSNMWNMFRKIVQAPQSYWQMPSYWVVNTHMYLYIYVYI